MLPHLADLQVERVCRTGNSIRIAARATASMAACPGCGTVSAGSTAVMSGGCWTRPRRLRGGDLPGGPPVLVPVGAVREEDLRRAGQRADHPPCAPHSGGDRGAGGGCAGAGRTGRCPPVRAVSSSSEPVDAAAAGPRAARPRAQRVAAGAGRGRVRAAQRAQLRDAAG